MESCWQQHFSDRRDVLRYLEKYEEVQEHAPQSPLWIWQWQNSCWWWPRAIQVEGLKWKPSCRGLRRERKSRKCSSEILLQGGHWMIVKAVCRAKRVRVLYYLFETQRKLRTFINWREGFRRHRRSTSLKEGGEEEGERREGNRSIDKRYRKEKRITTNADVWKSQKNWRWKNWVWTDDGHLTPCGCGCQFPLNPS